MSTHTAVPSRDTDMPPMRRAAAPAGRSVSWRIIALKELRELLVTGRFQAAAALVFGLLAVTLVFMTRSYARALQEYGIADAARLASLRQDGHLNRATMWLPSDPPNPLSVLVSGLTDNGRLHAFDNDTLAIAFPPADLVMVIGIVLSLVAVLFAHDAFTGERERGTLRLLVSGAAARSSILAGKLAGRFAALLVPLAAGLLAGAMALAIARDIGWSLPETAAFLTLAGIATLYVAIFVALGIFVSAWTRTTHGSLAGSLLAWAVFILIIPSVAPYVAAALSPTGNVALHQRERRTIMDTERDALIEQLQAEWQAPVRNQHPELEAYYALPAAERPAARAADPVLAAALVRLAAIADSAIDVANQRQREKRARLDEAFEARRQAQIRLTGQLASLSPYAALVLASLDLTETGPRAASRRQQQSAQWMESTFMPWLMATMDSARAADPTMHWNRRIELQDVPRFVYAGEPVSARAAAAFPQTGALVGFGLLFVLAGLVGFRRYDVR
jgi:ABC-type transport system involved in multi-copper enzyme maturation permease subunit